MFDRDTEGVRIELRSLTKHYPGQPAPAVDDVTLDIPAGELVVLVGPSGCGKTTTMKMINRLVEPSSGEIRIGGQDVLGLNPDQLRRHIGYAIQQVGLFPHQTVAQNIGLVPKLLGWSADRINARVEELLSLVSLEPSLFRDRYPRQLSGGQQQRVGVARALAADPPVMLMDEPFGATDPITREHLQNEFARLQKQLRKTIIFVTHDFEEAIKLGDRIAILRERSHIAQYDTPAAILAAPADDYVAGFIGQDGTLKRLALLSVADVTPALPPDTRLPQVSADASLREALDLMLSHGTDQCSSPTGVLTYASLCEAVGAPAEAVVSGDR
ncbi:ATP-binding cassette domain-containing protein [Nonomuraea fuscirosea]|uniref:ABC transporter ATP-binding protein n=1 Tax=Nonomuraea fuscirosea TaxID=1291556 RepID=UPI002DDA4BDB|nr:ATP-binding cassette domain-containing protein [Nonomuraea fuscirosea]WSA56592.1 ATP-binding cassette domain-containing protein [Nonomuraea fuscirosea]